MDNVDAKILKLLREDSRISITELSKQVNLSRPSVQERLQKMIDSDIISGFTIINKPQKIGYSITFYVMISEIKTSYEILVQILKDNPNVIEIYCVSGKVNYLVKVVAVDVEEMHTFLKDLRQLSLVETMIVLEDVESTAILEPIIK